MSYYMGDFYVQGYRGDPGIGSFFKGLVTKGLGMVPVVGPALSAVAGKVMHVMPGGAKTAIAQYPVGTLSAAGSITQAAKGVIGRASTAIVKHPALSAAGAAGAIAAGAGAIGMHMGRKGAAVVGRRRRKRMNVCNPRALRRAIRRTHGFAKLAMRTIHLVHPKKKARFGGFRKRRKAA